MSSAREPATVEPSDTPDRRAAAATGSPSSEQPPSETIAQLYAEHAAGLRSFLIGLVGSEADAADCLHDCFVAFVKHGHRCAPAARRAWLYRVARNQAALFFRRRAAGKQALEKTARSTASSDAEAEDVVGPLMASERREAVRAAIGHLTPPQREIVGLRIEQDLTFREIADHLQIPLGTALTRMRAALKALSQELRELNEDRSAW